MDLKLHAKNCEITESMKAYALERFNFLGDEEYLSVHLTVELIHKHAVKLKASVQPESVTVTVEASDYYNGINMVSKRIKTQLLKTSKTRKQHDCHSIGQSFNNIDNNILDEPLLKETALPLYQFSLEDALSQLELSSDNVLFFTEDGTSIQLLVKDEEKTIKLYSTTC